MKEKSEPKKPTAAKTLAVNKGSVEAPKREIVEVLERADVVLGLDTLGRVTYSINKRAPSLNGEIGVRPGATVAFSCRLGALAVGLLPVKPGGPGIEFRVGCAEAGGRGSFTVPKEAKSGLYKYTFTIFFDKAKSKTDIGNAMTVDPNLRIYS